MKSVTKRLLQIQREQWQARYDDVEYERVSGVDTWSHDYQREVSEERRRQGRSGVEVEEEEVVDYAGLSYRADWEVVVSLCPYLVSKFVRLRVDEATREFLDECVTPSPWQSFRTCCLRPLLRMCWSHTAVNGFLKTGQMFILSTQQLRRLLPRPSPDAGPSAAPGVEDMLLPGGARQLERVLDVGAGDGRVTQLLAPLFNEVVTTEVSVAMARNLRAKGFTCHVVWDLADLPRDEHERQFDVVTLFNVIDRCNNPITLLQHARSLMRDGPLSRCIVATPLPLNQWVESGKGWELPEEVIELVWPDDNSPAQIRNLSWEESVALLTSQLFLRLGFTVESVSRAPYLSQGDMTVPYYVLDDAIFVLGKGVDGQFPVNAMEDVL